MLVLEDAILKKENRKNFVALGSFDGLHKGHLSLIRKIKQLAEEGKGQSIVYTFKNHPRKFININSTLNLLMTNEEKISILEKEGIDILAFKKFDKETMKMSPEDFIKNICESFNIKGIVVGFNFKFGYKNAGAIVDGEYTDEIGGGVCQVATTVYNAVYDAGYPIVERHNHTLYIASYPEGRDAAIAFP